MDKIRIDVGRTKNELAEDQLIAMVHQFLALVSEDDLRGKLIRCDSNNSCGLEKYIETIAVDDNFMKPYKDSDVIFYFYRVHEREKEVEKFESEEENNSEEVAAYNHWLLPSRDFEGLWESLLFQEGVKENILRFTEIALKFSAHKVDTNIISCNRLVLLHGPPGTGKTSLCKAIAQKLSIRLGPVFKYTHLVEINSHSLFSKWFSESGKLVQKMFNMIRELISMPTSLVCVLIDEVESLAYARSDISSGEPRDSLRVVNAILTQLDQIKNYPNVLILTTSNLTSTIDLAFLDRADIKQFIDNPGTKAIYDIYKSAIEELIRVGLVKPCANDNKKTAHIQLQRVAESSKGLSGRALRKIPFIAHTFFAEAGCPTTEQFIKIIDRAVQKHFQDEMHVQKAHIKTEKV